MIKTAGLLVVKDQGGAVHGIYTGAPEVVVFAEQLWALRQDQFLYDINSYMDELEFLDLEPVYEYYIKDMNEEGIVL